MNRMRFKNLLIHGTVLGSNLLNNCAVAAMATTILLNLCCGSCLEHVSAPRSCHHALREVHFGCHRALGDIQSGFQLLNRMRFKNLATHGTVLSSNLLMNGAAAAMASTILRNLCCGCRLEHVSAPRSGHQALREVQFECHRVLGELQFGFPFLNRMRFKTCHTSSNDAPH